MTARVLDGAAIAAGIRAEVTPGIAAFTATAGRPPGLPSTWMTLPCCKRVSASHPPENSVGVGLVGSAPQRAICTT